MVGGKAWRDFQLASAGKLSAQYDLMMQEMDAGKLESAMQRGTDIIEKNPDTHYAVLAALALAKVYVNKGENDKAAERLSWAVTANKDEDFQHIIRLRLAKVLIAQNKLDEAMTHASFPDTGTFSAQYAILKGDIYYKKGEFESAKTAYQSALADNKLSAQLKNFVQLKIEDLGGSEAGEAL